MKKLILLTPLLVVPALMGCNKASNGYLELWSKEIYYKDNVLCRETTAKIEGKHYVETNETTYDEDGKTPISTIKTTTTYNDHDDIKTIVTERHSLVSNVTDTKTTANYTYDYRDDGLISKMTIVTSYNTGHESKEECTYEYDNLKRITQVKCTLDNDLIYESNSTYNTKFNIFSYNETWEINLDYWHTTTNTINDVGDVIESISEPKSKNKSINKAIFSTRDVFTYDEYHCPIHAERFRRNDSASAWKKTVTIDSIFHKNNPEKLLKSTETTLDEIKSTETTTTNTYDEYDRKTSQLILAPSLLSGKEKKTEWEYDQVIPA